MVLRVHLMYLFKGPCYVNRSLVYMDLSYVLYIRQTLYKMQIVYNYGTVLCTLIMHHQPGVHQATPLYIRWTLKRCKLCITMKPSYVL